jgi:hypothetical protein
MITGVRRVRLIASNPIVGFALAGCWPTAENARAIRAERPRAMLEGHPYRPRSKRMSDRRQPRCAIGRRSGVLVDGRGGDSRASTDAEDCVAVPEVGCCRLGFTVAVNRDKMVRGSPHIRMRQRDRTMHDGFRRSQSGGLRNRHHCQLGYVYDRRNRVPDIPGACIVEMGDDLRVATVALSPYPSKSTRNCRAPVGIHDARRRAAMACASEGPR